LIAAADEIRIHTHTHTHTHNRKLLAAADEISSEAQHVIPKRCQEKEKAKKRNEFSATPPPLSRPLSRSVLKHSIRASLVLARILLTFYFSIFFFWTCFVKTSWALTM
jgi:hypothetical protein